MRYKEESTKITFSFKGKRQASWFLIIKEYYKNGEMDYAEIIFELWPTKRLWRKKHFY